MAPAKRRIALNDSGLWGFLLTESTGRADEELPRTTSARLPKFAFLIALSAFTASPAWPFLPVPMGNCSEKLIDSLRKDVRDEQLWLDALSKKVLADDRLHASEVQTFLDYHSFRTNIELIKDPAFRERSQRGTPAAIAKRLEALRPSLTPKEWNRAVKLWAEYLHRTSEALAAYDPETLCGAREEGSSIAYDIGVTVVSPLAVIAMPVAVPLAHKLFPQGESNLKKALDVPVSMVYGLIYGPLALTSDVITFVPSVVMARKNQLHLERSAKAFDSFAKYAARLEAKYAAPARP